MIKVGMLLHSREHTLFFLEIFCQPLPVKDSYIDIYDPPAESNGLHSMFTVVTRTCAPGYGGSGPELKCILGSWSAQSGPRDCCTNCPGAGLSKN